MKFSLRNSMRWSIFISIATFGLSCLFSVAATAVLEGVPWGIGVLIVYLLILNGILFDVMGLAAAAAKETPFHAMAAEKVKGAKEAIRIIRNADRFSNFCNDVIGDISGIISGVASAFVVLEFLSSIGEESPYIHTVVSVLFTGLVSAMTVGGKALGKSFAIRYSVPIILTVGKIFYFLDHKFHIQIFKNTKNKGNNGKSTDQAQSGKRGKTSAPRQNP